MIKVRGRVDRREDETKLIAAEVKHFDGVSESRPLQLTIDAERVHAGVLGELK